jgi:hypothetical protein
MKTYKGFLFQFILFLFAVSVNLPVLAVLQSH